MPPTLHALLSPSKCERWSACTPSARLEEKLIARFGDAGSPFARRGTKAHSLAEIKLRKEKGEINQFMFDEQKKALIETAKDLDWKELDWLTDIYVDAVMTSYYQAKKLDDAADLLIEERYDMSRWVPGCFGTSDATVVCDGFLAVFDLKAGSGVPVTAVGNPQERLYGLGAVNAWGDLYKFPVVENHIIQPMLNALTEETMTREELLAWGEALSPIAKQAYEGVGEYHAGDHCRFCAARALCYHRALECMKVVTETGMQDPGIIPDSEIPKILDAADTAKKWIEDIQQYAQTQALKGQVWPGYKLVEGRRPPRRWTNEADIVDQLSRAGYPEDKIYVKEILGVGEAEKLLGKPAFRAILGPYTSQPSGAPTLVPESDKRVAINSTEAAFGDLGETIE